MPFRKAYLYVLALLALTFVAFWPSYLGNLPAGKMAWHFHAASAVLWTVLAIVQSWTIHHDRIALHRQTGLAFFLLFPLFVVAGIWVIHVEATTLAGGLNDPDNKELAQFGFFDVLANLGFALLFWGGLKYRHKVHLHARYMLATLLFVVAPIVFRLLPTFIPFFRSGTPETAHRFSYAMGVGNGVAVAIALYLYSRAPKHGRPFLLAAGIIAAQEVLFETLGRLPAWAPVFARVADVNLPFLLTLTGIVSLGIAWHGWVSGARPVSPKVAATV
ncbi:MAG: hypothetical protein M3Q19_07820 [Pseudomonadota bacterium]|nr:hypothetical protein [Pseudomonadota bacterium]